MLTMFKMTLLNRNGDLLIFKIVVLLDQFMLIQINQ